ncbi:MAG: RimK/LysX family protein [Candidatus Aenigmatarchaeota archaeon]
MKVVGLVEDIAIIGKNRVKTKALFDTGAKTTSVDITLAAKAQLGPVIRTIRIKAASLKGRTQRPVVEAIIEIKGQKFEVEVNLQDRSHMTFPVIIGRNILAGNFLVDAKRHQELFKRYGKEIPEA